MSVAIYNCKNNVVDFFFSTGIIYQLDRTTFGSHMSWTCPDLYDLLNGLGITSDRYQVIDLSSALDSLLHYSRATVLFSNDDDIVMVKLAFEQTGKTATSIINKLKQLDGKLITQ